MENQSSIKIIQYKISTIVVKVLDRLFYFFLIDAKLKIISLLQIPDGYVLLDQEIKNNLLGNKNDPLYSQSKAIPCPHKLSHFVRGCKILA